MDDTPLPTLFAPAERASDETIAAQAAAFASLVDLVTILDTVPDFVMVLNEQRQAVMANRALRRAVESDDALTGLRPGEIVECIHAMSLPGGCGTGEACAQCGAARAILNSLRGEEAVYECRITTRSGRALDFQAWASPLEANGGQYVALTLRDISHEKRRSALERTFFHDILNVAGTLSGFAEMMESGTPVELEAAKDTVRRLSARLVDEIQAQQDLILAENDELAVRLAAVNTLEALRSAQALYTGHKVAVGRDIAIDPQAVDLTFVSDARLLNRVIGNMLKNALEASERGGTVTLGCREKSDGVVFSVHNDGFMPRAVQLQVFQRSFSTRGEGRGLGTYGMRLLSERYLQGKVWFTTSKKQGTTFFARYPLVLH